MRQNNVIKNNLDQYPIFFDKELPEWILPCESFIEKDKDIDVEDGAKFLVLETQYYIKKDSMVRYIRSLRKIVSMTGVENYSKIFLELNEHLSLTVHQINVRRNGVLYEKISSADMQVLQREHRAESNIFSGDLTLSIILDDIQIGDEIEVIHSYIDSREDNYEIHEWKSNSLTFSSKITIRGGLSLSILRSLENNPESEFWKYVQDRYSRFFNISETLKTEIDRSKSDECEISISISYKASSKLMSSNKLYTIEAIMIDLFGEYSYSLPSPEDAKSDVYFSSLLNLKYTANFNDRIVRYLPDLEVDISNDVFSYIQKRSVNANIVTYHHEYKIKNSVIKLDDYTACHKKLSEMARSEVMRFTSTPAVFYRPSVSSIGWAIFGLMWLASLAMHRPNPASIFNHEDSSSVVVASASEENSVDRETEEVKKHGDFPPQYGFPLLGNSR